MSNFDFALKYTLENEGGWTVDSGGMTLKGITVPDVALHRHIPESSITEQIMRNLSDQEISDIYKEQYWNPVRLGEIVDERIACAIFDTSVNRGLSVGAKYAQRVCNLLGAALVVDGQIGIHSLAAINACLREPFIRTFENMEAAGYEAIIAYHPSYTLYRNGWMARCKRLFSLI